MAGVSWGISIKFCEGLEKSSPQRSQHQGKINIDACQDIDSQILELEQELESLARANAQQLRSYTSWLRFSVK